MTHACPIAGCANHKVPRRVYMCARHWRMVPKPLQAAVYESFRAGWASLIMLKAKPYEFRRWNFADKPHLAKLIGRRIVIHAGARAVRVSELEDVLARIEEGESALDAPIARPFVEQLLIARRSKQIGAAPLAVALGTAVLGAPRNVVDLFKDKVADSDRLDEHMYGWPLTDVQSFPAPIPALGAQGFWNWS